MDVSISIIVAIYNRRDELTELLDSLLVQEDKDFEIVIVDDGSSVELLPVVDLYQGKLNIQYFKTLKIIFKLNRPTLLVERIKLMKISPIYKRQFPIL